MRVANAIIAVCLFGACAFTLGTMAGPDASGTTPAEAAGSPVKGLKRTFRSSFEEPISIVGRPWGSEAVLKGAELGGDSWNRLDHVFELVAGGAFSKHVTLELTSDKAATGSRSLYMRQNLAEDGAQARLQFFGNDNKFGTEILTRRAYFVPSTNLRNLTREDESVSIAGTRETRNSIVTIGHPDGVDFSMPLYLVRRGPELVFAQAIVDYSAGPNWSDWTRPPKGLLTYGAMTACPLDRWFQLDVYILRNPSKGKIKVWLDDKLIFDLSNVRTKNDAARWFTKLADVDTEPAPFELWVDNVEIWSR